MKLRCPVCHSSNSLEAYGSDAAGRDLLALLAKSGPLFWPVVSYLGLFRPAQRDLANERALRLAQEVLEIGADPALLAEALRRTVEAMREKRDRGIVKPLKDHRYLLSVLESVELDSGAVRLDTQPLATLTGEPIPAAKSKRRETMERLGKWGAVSALRQHIAIGLIGLVSFGRPGTPAADTIAINADLWLHLLERHGLRDCVEDVDRVFRAFSGLAQQPMKEWPEPAALLPHLPRRRHQDKLSEPPLPPEERERGKAAVAGIISTLTQGKDS